MDQSMMRKLSAMYYQPRYVEHEAANATKDAVRRIVQEEQAHGESPLETSRAIRTRVHALLQGRTADKMPLMGEVEDLPLHQAAHLDALWKMTDRLVEASGYEVTL